MRIGLFGGSFNPVHFGHLRSALEVKEGFGLDEVVFIPAALPPHKSPGALAAAADRIRMIEIALGGMPGFRVSDIEARRPGPSFTIDTARHFRRAGPPEARFYLIMGLDAFLEIDTWRSFRELLALVPVVVLTRPGPVGKGLAAERESLLDFLRAAVSAEAAASVSAEAAVFRAPGIEPITLFPVSALDISSTRIRRIVAAGGSPQYLLPAEVWRHIQTEGLYR
jgi:nicotinate-nucleotide adenylyltransferase